MNDATTPDPAVAAMDESSLRWEMMWRKHKGSIIGLAVVVVLGLSGFGGWTAWQVMRDDSAARALAVAEGIDDLERVASEYAGTMPAADALMRLAAARREAGDLEGSTAAFREFLDRYPRHELAGGALLGVGQNLDESGDTEGAIEVYRQVVTEYPSSYAAPFAAYSEADILLRAFKRGESLRSFNMIISQYPASPVARMAASQAARIGSLPGTEAATPPANP